MILLPGETVPPTLPTVTRSTRVDRAATYLAQGASSAAAGMSAAAALAVRSDLNVGGRRGTVPRVLDVHRVDPGPSVMAEFCLEIDGYPSHAVAEGLARRVGALDGVTLTIGQTPVPAPHNPDRPTRWIVDILVRGPQRVIDPIGAWLIEQIPAAKQRSYRVR